jgi:hypothetical protein
LSKNFDRYKWGLTGCLAKYRFDYSMGFGWIEEVIKIHRGMFWNPHPPQQVGGGAHDIRAF